MDGSPQSQQAQLRQAHSRQQFIDAWQQALRTGGEPPSIDPFLVAFDEQAGVEFQRDLQSIDSLFCQRLNQGDDGAPSGVDCVEAETIDQLLDQVSRPATSA